MGSARSGWQRLASLLGCALCAVAGSDLPVHAGKLYWTLNTAPTEGIRRSNLNGSDVEEILTLGDQRAPKGIALDLGQGKIYWAESSGKVIRRANLDGSELEDLVEGLESPRWIALDLVTGSVYWTDAWAGKIQRADLDGSNMQDVLVGLDFPRALAVDSAAGKLYWGVHGDGIRRADRDGSNAETVVAAARTRALALELQGGKIYWSDLVADKIQRANLDGSEVEDLVVEGVSSLDGIAVDATAGKMYWTDNHVLRANLDGSNVEEIVDVYGAVGVALAVVGLCGDGTLDHFEECDDGNTVDGDGCQGECLLPECGDGSVDAGEPCDDGNTVSCDGCSAFCLVETGFVCGDGELNTTCGEQCDDGNNTSADGCQFNCLLPTCGDGIVDPEEKCDDGDELDTDECSNDCNPPGHVLYDQTDEPSFSNVNSQVHGVAYQLYDCEAADDFIVTGADGWDVETVVTVGRASGHDDSLHMNIRFYHDEGGEPGSTVLFCEFVGVTEFEQDDGDVVTTLPTPCKLDPGRYWVSQQVRKDTSYGWHYLDTSVGVSNETAKWRNPGDGFGTGCLDWGSECPFFFSPSDLIFQLRGTELDSGGDGPGHPVPAVGPLGALLTALALGAGLGYALLRRQRETRP